MKTFKELLTEAAKKASGKKTLSNFPSIHHCVAANLADYSGETHEAEHEKIAKVTVPKAKHGDYKKTETFFKKKIGDSDPKDFFAKELEKGASYPGNHEEVLDHAHALTYAKFNG